MNIVITGSSTGMGKAACEKFLAEGHTVFGIDILGKTIDDPNYYHYIADVSKYESLPEIPGVNVLVNNAGAQDSGRDIDVNLRGVINCTRKYGLQENIISILNQCCASAHTGCQFEEYVASKGGVLSYTKWTAKEVAQYGAICNSLSFGGVFSDVNIPVIDNEELWQEIMNQTPLKRWATCKEAADWIYFMCVVNKSATGQDIVIDNGEMLNGKFIWI